MPVLGVDIGGTKIAAGVVSEAAVVLRCGVTPTLAPAGYAASIAQVYRAIETMLAPEVTAIGICAPGPLNPKTGVVINPPNLPGWHDVPLARLVSESFSLPCRVENDANATALAEWKFGAGKGVQNLIFITMGTGIGGGLVINDQLQLGIGGTAGELGHMTIDFNGPRCGCGNYGCVEAYASGPAITAMGLKAVTQGLTTKIADLCENDLNRITPELIARAAQDGDEIAKDIYERAGFYLGIAAANVCVTVGPRRIIIAGGVSQAGGLLLDPIRRTVRERVTVMPVEQVEVLPSQLGNNAGVIGVACWAAKQL